MGNERPVRRKKRSWPKRIAFVMGTLLAAAAIAYGFVPDPEPVELAELSRGEVTTSVEGDGRTRVVERFVVTAPATGNLRRVSLIAGDAIRPSRGARRAFARRRKASEGARHARPDRARPRQGRAGPFSCVI